MNVPFLDACGSISNLPPEEDLIIVMTGNGSRKIAANYGEVLPPPSESEYKLVIDSTNNSKVEILDAATASYFLLAFLSSSE